MTARMTPEAKKARTTQETLAQIRVLHDQLAQRLYSHPVERPLVDKPEAVADLMRPFVGALDHEELWVLNLDSRNRVMSMDALYKGSVSAAQVRVAEVFRKAIIENAPALVLVHNHPSGDPTPSSEDAAVTRAIASAGKLLDINVLDHVVIGALRHVSLRERGLMYSV